MRLLLFLYLLLSFHFTANGQEVDIVGEWLKSNTLDLKFIFEENGKLIVEKKRIEAPPLLKKFTYTIDENLIVLKDNGNIFDTLNILQNQHDLLTMYQHFEKKEVTFYNLKNKLADSLVHKFLLFKDIDFYVEGENERALIKRGIHNFFFGFEQCINRRFPPIENYVFNSKRDDHLYKLFNTKLKPIEIKGDTLIANVIGKEQRLLAIKIHKISKIPDELIGRWIMVNDKEKFDASFNKKSKTVYIGHAQLEIFPDNRCIYNAEGQEKAGTAYSEHFCNHDQIFFHGNDLYGDPYESGHNGYNLRYSFELNGKLKVIDEKHFILEPTFDWQGSQIKYFIKID